MRLFFALWPDPALQSALAQHARSCHPVCGGRRVTAEKLHVTAAFLGEVEASRYPELIAIAEAASAHAFELRFDRIGYWRHNRIVYAAASETPQALSELERTLAQRLAEAGFRTEQRAYVPHVTLLRDARRAPRAVTIAPLTWRVDRLTLVETLLSEQKSLYRQRQCWTLIE